MATTVRFASLASAVLVALLQSAGCAHGIDEKGAPEAAGASGATNSATGGSGGNAGIAGSSAAGGTVGTGSTNGNGGGLGDGGSVTGGQIGADTGIGGAGGAMNDSDSSVDPPAIAGDLVVQYRTNDEPADNEIRPQFNVVNRGAQAVVLASLTIRYFYTIDGTALTTADYQQVWLDYADISRITNGGTTATVAFGRLEPSQTGADHYIEVGFDGPDALGAGEATNQIEVRANWEGYSHNYDETNDYSWDGSKTTFVDWANATLYENGVLIWGIEPDGTVPALGDAGDADAAAAFGDASGRASSVPSSSDAASD